MSQRALRSVSFVGYQAVLARKEDELWLAMYIY
jgi:hypothetical protein